MPAIREFRMMAMSGVQFLAHRVHSLPMSVNTQLHQPESLNLATTKVYTLRQYSMTTWNSRIMDVSFPCTFVPGNETTIQSAVYTVDEVTDDSRPLRRAAFYMEISNNDLGQFYHSERPHLRTARCAHAVSPTGLSRLLVFCKPCDFNI